MVDELTVADAFPTDVGRAERVAQGGLQEVVGPCGAVVEDEVVEVLAILGLGIGHQGLEDSLFLQWGEQQGLLMDIAMLVAVLGNELMIGLYAEFVPGLALHEVPVEMTIFEREQTIVEHIVDTLHRVANAYSGVSITFVKRLTRFARE